MQDAIMKGSGNSRYLKTVGEALSLYPTYEDFLQAMIAGTFPVDFNGINKDGWTQLGTPLNKANLLSDTVISTLGLSTGANSTPNDAFNVLANVGNVHVWRKTVVAEEEVPAGYTLGPVQNSNIDIFGGYSNYTVTERGVWRYSKTISVDANGTISLDNYSLLDVESTWSGNNNDAYVAKQCLSGSFAICIDAPTGWDSENIHPLYPPIVGKVYFFPDDIEVLDIERPDTSGYLEVAANKYQEVTSNPYVPAGTHITYLTSTNRNAYQEGADGSEKPAGYKLGSKITGNIALTDRTNESSTIYWNYSDQVDVSDDGKVSLIAPNRVDFNATQSNAVNMAESLVGNFIMTTSSATAIKANTVYFIPDDASVAREMSGTKFVYTTAIQSVTGYPAIPAGTTIEYLGVLGDKTSIETGSYVGTGTYGSGNPNTLTFGFEPKFVHIQSYSIGNADGTGYGFAFFLSGTRGFTIGPSSSNDLYHLNAKFNKNILSWYQNNEYAQLNEKKVKYFFAALG